MTGRRVLHDYYMMLWSALRNKKKLKICRMLRSFYKHHCSDVSSSSGSVSLLILAQYTKKRDKCRRCFFLFHSHIFDRFFFSSSKEYMKYFDNAGYLSRHRWVSEKNPHAASCHIRFWRSKVCTSILQQQCTVEKISERKTKNFIRGQSREVWRQRRRSFLNLFVLFDIK